MNTTEKYLDALQAAIDANDQRAIQLLDPFVTHLYKEIDARAGAASVEDRAAWEHLLRRMKNIIAGMANAGPDLW